ncbi:Protein of unknown function [Gryllus bimaculatus]|nr:Protein of unknown function [Gryllus bimaculatus]
MAGERRPKRLLPEGMYGLAELWRALEAESARAPEHELRARVARLEAARLAAERRVARLEAPDAANPSRLHALEDRLARVEQRDSRATNADASAEQACRKVSMRGESGAAPSGHITSQSSSSLRSASLRLSVLEDFLMKRDPNFLQPASSPDLPALHQPPMEEKTKKTEKTKEESTTASLHGPDLESGPQKIRVEDARSARMMPETTTRNPADAGRQPSPARPIVSSASVFGTALFPGEISPRGKSKLGPGTGEERKLAEGSLSEKNEQERLQKRLVQDGDSRLVVHQDAKFEVGEGVERSEERNGESNNVSVGRPNERYSQEGSVLSLYSRQRRENNAPTTMGGLQTREEDVSLPRENVNEVPLHEPETSYETGFSARRETVDTITLLKERTQDLVESLLRQQKLSMRFNRVDEALKKMESMSIQFSSTPVSSIGRLENSNETDAENEKETSSESMRELDTNFVSPASSPATLSKNSLSTKDDTASSTTSESCKKADSSQRVLSNNDLSPKKTSSTSNTEESTSDEQKTENDISDDGEKNKLIQETIASKETLKINSSSSSTEDSLSDERISDDSRSGGSEKNKLSQETTTSEDIPKMKSSSSVSEKSELCNQRSESSRSGDGEQNTLGQKTSISKDIPKRKSSSSVSEESTLEEGRSKNSQTSDGEKNNKRSQETTISTRSLEELKRGLQYYKGTEMSIEIQTSFLTYDSRSCSSYETTSSSESSLSPCKYFYECREYFPRDNLEENEYAFSKSAKNSTKAAEAIWNSRKEAENDSTKKQTVTRKSQASNTCEYEKVNGKLRTFDARFSDTSTSIQRSVGTAMEDDSSSYTQCLISGQSVALHSWTYSTQDDQPTTDEGLSYQDVGIQARLLEELEEEACDRETQTSRSPDDFHKETRKSNSAEVSRSEQKRVISISNLSPAFMVESPQSLSDFVLSALPNVPATQKLTYNKGTCVRYHLAVNRSAATDPHEGREEMSTQTVEKARLSKDAKKHRTHDVVTKEKTQRKTTTGRRHSLTFSNTSSEGGSFTESPQRRHEVNRIANRLRIRTDSATDSVQRTGSSRPVTEGGRQTSVETAGKALEVLRAQQNDASGPGAVHNLATSSIPDLRIKFQKDIPARVSALAAGRGMDTRRKEVNEEGARNCVKTTRRRDDTSPRRLSVSFSPAPMATSASMAESASARLATAFSYRAACAPRPAPPPLRRRADQVACGARGTSPHPIGDAAHASPTPHPAAVAPPAAGGESSRLPLQARLSRVCETLEGAGAGVVEPGDASAPVVVVGASKKQRGSGAETVMVLPGGKAVPMWADPESPIPYTVIAYPMARGAGGQKPQQQQQQQQRRRSDQSRESAERRRSADEQQLSQQLQQQQRRRSSDPSREEEVCRTGKDEQPLRQQPQTQQQRRISDPGTEGTERRTSRDEQQLRHHVQQQQQQRRSSDPLREGTERRTAKEDTRLQQQQQKQQQQHRRNSEQSAHGSEPRPSKEEQHQQRLQTHQQRRSSWQSSHGTERRPSKEEEQHRRRSTPPTGHLVDANQARGGRRLSDNQRNIALQKDADMAQQRVQHAARPPYPDQQLNDARPSQAPFRDERDSSQLPVVSSEDTEVLVQVVDVESGHKFKKDVQRAPKGSEGAQKPRSKSQLNRETNQQNHEGSPQSNVLSDQPSVSGVRRLTKDIQDVFYKGVESLQKVQNRISQSKDRVNRDDVMKEQSSGKREIDTGPRDVMQNIWKPSETAQSVYHTETDSVETTAGRVFRNPEELQRTGIHPQDSAGPANDQKSLQGTEKNESSEKGSAIKKGFRRLSQNIQDAFHKSKENLHRVGSRTRQSKDRIPHENEDGMRGQTSGERGTNREFQEFGQDIWKRPDTELRVYQAETGGAENAAERAFRNPEVRQTSEVNQQDVSGQEPQIDQASLQGTDNTTISEKGSAFKRGFRRLSHNIKDAFHKSMENLHRIGSRTHQSKERISNVNEDAISRQTTDERDRNRGLQDTVQDIWKRPDTVQRVYQTEPDNVATTAARVFRDPEARQTTEPGEQSSSGQVSEFDQESLQTRDNGTSSGKGFIS